MPATLNVQNNFIGGLKTEFTGLNFPENAATDTDNCVYTLIGDVLRREGIDYETNFTQNTIDRTNKAVSSYKWNNVGGDGSTQIVVVQVGYILYFYQSSDATSTSPLSAHLLASTINLASFLPLDSSLDPSVTECQFSDGNGYLFVHHPKLDPFYCTFQAGIITGNLINVQIRDFDGYFEPGVADNFRPPLSTIGVVHGYNLANQGWGKLITSSWTQNIQLGVTNILNTLSSRLPIKPGDQIKITKVGSNADFQTGSVVTYNPSTGIVGMTISSTGGVGGFAAWVIDQNPNLIATWIDGVGNAPSNADVWWNYKDSTNTFNPRVTVTKTTQNAGPAPKGYFLLDAFNIDRSKSSSIGNIIPITTFIRPKTGTWFQGRVWYAGVDASVTSSGATSSGFYSWTEKIYFSQIVFTADQFGKCYQRNDPTSETLFDILPTDGGVIQIQGCGSIYKLFPVQNGLLVFAANGIWFITGSQGIGFSATDYTITKISSVHSISSIPFVDLLGYPVFWNEEGIYSVSPNPQGGLQVDNMCVGTILSYYANIPLQSKKFARGAYNPIDFTIQWVFKSVNETTVSSRYEYDKTLNLNTANKAFYPYSLPTSSVPKINGLIYIEGPGGSTTPSPTFKYLVSIPSAGSFKFSFAEEHDAVHYKDWFSFDNAGIDYTSFFVTGYRIAGKALTKWQPQYVYMFLRGPHNTYKIQGIWDFAASGDSGKFSTVQVVTSTQSNFNMLYRRHKIRGHGLVLQIKVASVDGSPFDIMGWSSLEQTNQGT